MNFIVILLKENYQKITGGVLFWPRLFWIKATSKNLSRAGLPR